MTGGVNTTPSGEGGLRSQRTTTLPAGFVILTPTAWMRLRRFSWKMENVSCLASWSSFSKNTQGTKLLMLGYVGTTWVSKQSSVTDADGAGKAV